MRRHVLQSSIEADPRHLVAVDSHRATVADWLAERLELARGGSSNVRSMEGLRGLAVFLVFFVHFTTLVAPWVPPGSPFAALAPAILTIGHSGVDLFFLLSGYLIYQALIRKGRPFIAYVSRRVQRIYPAFMAVLVLYVILSFIFPSENKIPSDSAAAVVYLVENALLLPGIFPILPLITVTWSLSYELLFYLLLPLVIASFGLRAWDRRARLALAMAVALLFGMTCAAFGGPARMNMFVAGIVLFELFDGRLLRPPPPVAGALCFVTAFALLVLLDPAPAYYTWSVASIKVPILFVFFTLACLSCFSHPQSAFARFFCWTPARWLGNMSYSYYLIHGVSLKGFFLVFGLLWSAGAVWYVPFWLAPLAFAASLVPALALFLLVERPYSLRASDVRR